MTKSVFILGTGFIGGSVLAALLDEKDRYEISALCRDEKKAKKLEELGVRPVMGELASDDVISKEAEQSDVSEESRPDTSSEAERYSQPSRTDHHAHCHGRRPPFRQIHLEGTRKARQV